jgi:hypothetical protein
MANQCKWIGISGKEYIYDIYFMDASWNNAPGNYIFARSLAPTIGMPYT